MMLKGLASAAAAIGLFCACQPAEAHPHIWVTVESEIVFDAGGDVAAIRHHWMFDEAYSSFIILGLDKDRDGRLTAEELRNVSVINVKALEEARYFTFVSHDGAPLDFASADDFSLDYSGRRVGLRFTLRLKNSTPADGGFLLRIYDPSFFVSLTLGGAEDAIRGEDQPANCQLRVTRPESVDEAKRIIPDGAFLAMAGARTYGEKFANEARLNCS